MPGAALGGRLFAEMVTGREARAARNVVLDLGMLRAFHLPVLRNDVARFVGNCHVGFFVLSAIGRLEMLPVATWSLTSGLT